MRLTSSITAAALALGLSFAAQAATSDSDFVKNASIGSNFELASSKAALDKSKRSDVREFAKTMIDDHTKAAAELKSAVNSSKVEADLADSKLDEKHQATLDKLNNASDTDFDGLYISAQKDAHHEAVALFTDYASHGENKTLKEYAAATLPTLKKHQQHVQQLK